MTQSVAGDLAGDILQLVQDMSPHLNASGTEYTAATSSTVCFWTGVTCQAGKWSLELTSRDLTGHRSLHALKLGRLAYSHQLTKQVLAGTLPPTLQGLPSLATLASLNMSSNQAPVAAFPKPGRRAL